MFRIKVLLNILLALALASLSTVKTTVTTATTAITHHFNTIDNSSLQWKFVEADIRRGLPNFYTDIPVEEHSDDPLTNPNCDQHVLRSYEYPEFKNHCVRPKNWQLHDNRYGVIVDKNAEDLQPFIQNKRLKFEPWHERFSCYKIVVPKSLSVTDIQFILSYADMDRHARFSLPQPELDKRIIYLYYDIGRYSYLGDIQYVRTCSVTHRQLLAMLNLPLSVVIRVTELPTMESDSI